MQLIYSSIRKMKPTLLLLLFALHFMKVWGQTIPTNKGIQKEFSQLIQQYSLARETGDTILLKKILTNDIDQLVSNGEWRMGMGAAVAGMLKSTAGNQGTRTLTIEQVKLLSPDCALIDCRYEISGTNGTVRKMWSSFIALKIKGAWKISAIRNMLPAKE